MSSISKTSEVPKTSVRTIETQTQETNYKSISDPCAICLEILNDFEGFSGTGEALNDKCTQVFLPGVAGKCGHVFHLACITEWVDENQIKGKEKAGCPVCRGPVDDLSGRSIVLDALKEKNFQFVIDFLHQGKMTSSRLLYVIEWAIKNDSDGLVIGLFETGCVSDEICKKVVHLTVQHKRLNLLDNLINRGGVISDQDQEKAFLLAVENEDEKLVTTLLKCGSISLVKKGSISIQLLEKTISKLFKKCSKYVAIETLGDGSFFDGPLLGGLHMPTRISSLLFLKAVLTHGPISQAAKKEAFESSIKEGYLDLAGSILDQMNQPNSSLRDTLESAIKKDEEKSKQMEEAINAGNLKLAQEILGGDFETFVSDKAVQTAFQSTITSNEQGLKLFEDAIKGDLIYLALRLFEHGHISPEDREKAINILAENFSDSDDSSELTKRGCLYITRIICEDNTTPDEVKIKAVLLLFERNLPLLAYYALKYWGLESIEMNELPEEITDELKMYALRYPLY
ncbi:MAG: hypothetical protein S4CHLAM7_06090 [Chlamydiae bacterium]|nr:hypothetical protein [Chlamydiota bacterium]